MSTDNPTWLRRAQANDRGVGSILYLPSDCDIENSATIQAYEVGINNGMRIIQAYYWNQTREVVAAGKTFRRYPVVTMRGNISTAEFETLGTYEGQRAILDEAWDKGVMIGGRAVRKEDGKRLFCNFVLAPKGHIGNAIGVDSTGGTRESVGNTFPWPGRTGLMGKGLDILAQVPVNYGPSTQTEMYDTTTETYKYENFADEIMEWLGAIAHELGHCFVGLPHPADWSVFTLMGAWWQFLKFPAAPLLREERAKLILSPFFR